MSGLVAPPYPGSKWQRERTTNEDGYDDDEEDDGDNDDDVDDVDVSFFWYVFGRCDSVLGFRTRRRQVAQKKQPPKVVPR